LIAVFSDVHANLEALRAVVHDISQRRVSRMFFLGDIIGYGPNPREVLDFLRNFEFCLMGNHDRAVLTGPPKNFNIVAQKATDWTRTQIHPAKLKLRFIRRGEYGLRMEYWNFLKDLLPYRRVGEMLFAHDNPTKPGDDHYVRTPEEAASAFAAQPDVKVFFVGHSHVPWIWWEDGRSERPDFGKKYTFDQRVIVNVGSVGQPRDKDPRACYVIVDDGFRFVRVEYDFRETMLKMGKTPLDRRLADRLEKGT
jgi:predicted phosphodiesterase